MHALGPLHDQFSDRMQFLHAKRFDALWRSVRALLNSKKLWLTAMGRCWPSDAKRKHAIKAADRILGNESLHADRFRIAASVAAMCLPAGSSHPVILVDTMEIRPGLVALTASIAHQGRSLSIWSTTVTALRANAAHCRRFIRELAKVLPSRCQPVLVTDGGFEREWFDEVCRKGWHYVGRVRGQRVFRYRDEVVGCHALHLHARKRPVDLGYVAFGRDGTQTRRLLLSKLPNSNHRRLKVRGGGFVSGSNYKHYRTNAHEPLLLATSLQLTPAQVVNIYERRMQIEQSFRDLKNHRWGWSLRHCLTRSSARIEMLLLIASIAALVQNMIGIAAEKMGLHFHHQANTVRCRRVLSFFTLGALVLRDDIPISSKLLKAIHRKMRNEIDHLGGLI